MKARGPFLTKGRIGGLVALLAMLAVLGRAPRWFLPSLEERAGVLWTMLNVNQGEKQGDAHLIQFRDGRAFLVDTGNRGFDLLPALRWHSVRRLEEVIITHPHKDHYGGLRELVASEIQVGKVRMNFPLREICDPERPWGCDYEDVSALFKELADRRIPVVPARAGDILRADRGGELKVLTAFDGLHMPWGDRSDINDTSAVLLLSYGGTRALFTGDLNQALGAWMAGHEPGIRADLLKVPHHGTEGTVPNEFFDRVHPRVALVPSPRTLWNSDRSARIREYFRGRGIPAWVNGIHGEVTVGFYPGYWLLWPERGWPRYGRPRENQPVASLGR